MCGFMGVYLFSSFIARLIDMHSDNKVRQILGTDLSTVLKLAGFNIQICGAHLAHVGHLSSLTLVFVFQFIDSDEDNDGYVDTDEEVSNGRVNLLNGSGPPYFHGYLYMKSESLYQVTAQQACR